MLTAIASTKDDLSGEISTQGARAPYYLLMDGDDLKKTLSNPFAKGGGGAAYAVAKLLEQDEVEKLVVVKIGDNMVTALAERGITFDQFEGTVKEYLKK